MKKQEPDLLFVEIKEPSATRRDVLMATKDVLDCLKKYEEYRHTKEQKTELLSQLKVVVDELGSLNRRLRSKMPKAPIALPVREKSAAWEKEEKVEKSYSGPSPSVARPKSKLDLLQEELEKIESRLGALE